MATISGGCTPCCSPSVCGILPPDKENPTPPESLKAPGSCEEKVCVHFDQFETGTVESNICFPGFILSTNLDPTDNPLMIFDSAAPTAGHEDLGSPNETCCDPPGPGIGAAGEMGQPGENCMDLKKVLIISDDPPTPGAPVPKTDGGIITLDFVEDVQTCEVHFLNVVGESCGFVKIYDFNDTLLSCEPINNMGANSFQIVEIVSPSSSGKTPVPVRRMVIELVNDAAIAKIVYKLCPNPARQCLILNCEDFDEYVEGAINMVIPMGTVTTNDPVMHPAMIFNSTVPTGGDTDLGTPNETCDTPGPGQGTGGEVGEPGENCVDLSHVLIISDDANAGDPKSYATGGQFIFEFDMPVNMKEVHFLNAAKDGDTVVMYDANDKPLDLLDVPNLGENSVSKIQTPNPYPVSKMIVNVSGKTAITKVVYWTCKGGSVAEDDFTCLEHIIEDWETYSPGDINVRHSDWTYTTTETLMIEGGTPSGNVLIASSDGNSETPTQKVGLFEMDFNFNCPIWLNTMTFDNCNTAGCNVELFGIDAASLGSFPIANLGLASTQTIIIDLKGVARAHVTLQGGVAELDYYHCCKPPVPRDICTLTRLIEFEQYTTGDRTLNLDPDVTISTADMENTPSMIFDSDNPGVNTQLGTPHTDFAGIGVGTGGATGKPGENSGTHNKVVIISGDCNSEIPVPKFDGGQLDIEFKCPVQFDELTLLNATAQGDTVALYDIDNVLLDTFLIGQFGDNSVQTIKTINGRQNWRGVSKVSIVTGVDLALVDFQFTECCDDPSDKCRTCLEEVTVDFYQFTAGNINLNIPDLTLSSDQNPVTNPLMIFDTENPTGGDTDLGTPNSDFAGPGIGSGGETGKPGENNVGLGNALIISTDADQMDPDKKDDGGVITIEFDDLVTFKSMILIDMTANNKVELYDEADLLIETQWIPKNGENGIVAMEFDTCNVKKAVITLVNCGAILEFTYCRCKTDSKIEYVQLLDNAMTPVEINCSSLQGSYTIMVESALQDGAKSIFMACSAHDAQAGAFTRIASAASLTDETVHLQWNGNEKIKLYHDIVKTGGIGVLLGYNVKVMTL